MMITTTGIPLYFYSMINISQNDLSEYIKEIEKCLILKEFYHTNEISI